MHDLGRLDRAERAGLPWHIDLLVIHNSTGREVGASEHEDGSAKSPGIQVAARTHTELGRWEASCDSIAQRGMGVQG